jgi:alpha,alpha-trehalase
MKPPHFMPSYGLSRYFDEGYGPCPETEPGHYNQVLAPYVGRAPFADTKTPEDLYVKLTAAYDANPKFRYPDKHLEDYFIQDRAERESGHDTTFRFDNRATDFLTVDLNSLLYKTEMDFITLMEQGVIPKTGEFGNLAQWKTRAQFRKKQMIELMYDQKTGLFFDFDMKNLKHSDYISATTFYPLWAHLVDKPMAEKVMHAGLANLLEAGGISATARVSLEKYGHKPGERQWEYPNGWAPHQILAWQGLRNYGFINESHDLINRWVTMISDNARDYNGTVPEKFDVVARSHAVFSEYGNVGTKFNYITREGFGWMNASFELGRMYEARDRSAEKSAAKNAPGANAASTPARPLPTIQNKNGQGQTPLTK